MSALDDAERVLLEAANTGDQLVAWEAAARTFLTRALDEGYLTGYSEDTSRVWLGVNAMALLARPEAMAVKEGAPDMAGRLAREIREQVALQRWLPQTSREDRLYAEATIAETLLATFDCDTALAHVKAYVAKPEVNVFALNNFRRQLDEVWHLDTRPSPCPDVISDAGVERNAGALHPQEAVMTFTALERGRPDEGVRHRAGDRLLASASAGLRRGGADRASRGRALSSWRWQDAFRLSRSIDRVRSAGARQHIQFDERREETDRPRIRACRPSTNLVQRANTEPAPPMPTWHDAFISYSHAADGPLAAALEAGLEQLAKPLLKRRALDVFRDQTSLTAAPALWPGIVAHLEASEWLVLLASPQSARSIWCNKEMQWWLDNRSLNRLLVLLTDGEIAWDRAAQDFDWSRTNALPRILERRCADEPLHIDLRWARSSELLTLRNATFRDAVVSVAAPIRGLAKDELDGADLRQLARNRMLVRGGVAAITVAAVIAVWQAMVANGQRTEAERQRDIAVSRQLAAQAELMRVQQPDRLPLALLMATQALRGQPESLEAQHTLRGLLARIPEPESTFAHTGPVSVARLSRDLEQLATAAEADAGALWSVRDGMRLAPLPGADRTVVWSADDRLIAGCCARVTVWNRAGEPQLQLTEHDLNGRAEDIVLSGDGRYLAVGISGENWIGVSVHDIASKTTVLRKQGRGESRGIPIAFAPNGDFFAAVNGELEWYPAGQWERPRRLNAGGGDVVRLAVSPDSRQLAVASTSSVSLVSLRQPERPRLLRSSGFGPSEIQDLVFNASGAYLGAIPGMGAGAIWEVGSAREIGEPTHGEFYTIHALSFSPTHAEALTCATDGNCFTWSLVDGRRLRQFSHVYADQADTRDVRALGSGGYGATGTLVVTSGRDKTARLWDLSDAAQEPAKRCDWSTPYISTHVAMSTSWHVTNGPRDPADTACATRFPELSRGVADTDATQRFAAVVDEQGEVHVWSLRDRRRIATLAHAETASDIGNIRVLAISPTGRRVATFRESGRGLRIWDTATGKPLLHETIAERDPPHIAFLGDDAMVRIDQLRTLSVVDLGKSATLWSTSAAGLVAFTIDAEGTRLAALTRREQGAVVRLWAATSGHLLLEQPIGFKAGEVKLDRSGQYIVVVGDSPIVPEVPPQPAEVLVLDIARKHAVLELPKNDGTIALDLSRDGSRLAGVTSTGELRVWELPSATVQRAVLATPGPVALSADGRWVAAGGGSIRVLNASTLRPAAQLEVDGSVLALEFQSDDALLAVRHDTQQSGMTLDAYRWRTEDLLGEACKRIPTDAAARQWMQLLPDQPIPTPCAAAP